ncbi:MAG: lecithin retinol acyltransferase family protein [Bacteroidota bacterium]
MKQDYIYLYPADRVVIPKSNINLVKHHGIYVGYINGRHWFLENHFNSGVRYVTAEQFLNGTSIDKIRIQRFVGSARQRQEAVNVAKNMLGRPYDLLSYNCEHYSNEVQYGKPESDQVKAGLFVAGLCVVFFGALTISN